MLQWVLIVSMYKYVSYDFNGYFTPFTGFGSFVQKFNFNEEVIQELNAYLEELEEKLEKSWSFASMYLPTSNFDGTMWKNITLHTFAKFYANQVTSEITLVRVKIKDTTLLCYRHLCHFCLPKHNTGVYVAYCLGACDAKLTRFN